MQRYEGTGWVVNTMRFELSGGQTTERAVRLTVGATKR